MLFMMLERGWPVDRVIHADTGKEFPAMYRHLSLVNARLKKYGLTVESVKVDFDYWFADHVKTKGRRQGQKGYGWPRPRSRWCTALKLDAINITAQSLEYQPRKWYGAKNGEGFVSYVGFAFDEMKRAAKHKKRLTFPLIDWKVTEKQALQYCYDLGFTWDGLYRHFHRVSCFCCPLKSLRELKALYLHFPDLWAKMKDLDRKSLFPFTRRNTLTKLETRFDCETAPEAIRERLPLLAALTEATV